MSDDATPHPVTPGPESGLANPSAQRRPARPPHREWMHVAYTSLMSGLLAVIVGMGVLAIVVPAVTGSTVLTVLSSSMEPTLPPGTMIVVRPTDPADITPGMVMTYQIASGEPAVATHRVTQSLLTADGERLFITQGDANASADPNPVRELQIKGTVWYAIPLLGWAALALQGEQRMIVITVAVIALFGYAVWAFTSSFIERSRARNRRAPTHPE